MAIAQKQEQTGVLCLGGGGGMGVCRPGALEHLTPSYSPCFHAPAPQQATTSSACCPKSTATVLRTSLLCALAHNKLSARQSARITQCVWQPDAHESAVWSHITWPPYLAVVASTNHLCCGGASGWARHLEPHHRAMPAALLLQVSDNLKHTPKKLVQHKPRKQTQTKKTPSHVCAVCSSHHHEPSKLIA